MPELSLPEWNDLLQQYPEAHLLQTSAWGELKASFGWNAVRVAADPKQGLVPPPGAQILFRNLPVGFSVAYLPKGPLSKSNFPADPDIWKALLPEIDAACHRRRAVFLKVEPDAWQEEHNPGELPPGFRPSTHPIQPARTLLVDLSVDEECILGQMKQKTRYNIKLALKKGVLVKTSADLDTFFHLMQITGGRDRFGVHNLDYYRRAYELFHPRGACELMVAEYEREPLAGLMVFASDKRAWYFYGASSSDHRERMPTYLLQWEAMRWARQRGCTEYDLWGVPDESEETLESQFSSRSDGLWGVYRFKRGFGGQLRRAAGPWDRVYEPLLYKLYKMWIKK